MFVLLKRQFLENELKYQNILYDHLYSKFYNLQFVLYTYFSETANLEIKKEKVGMQRTLLPLFWTKVFFSKMCWNIEILYMSTFVENFIAYNLFYIHFFCRTSNLEEKWNILKYKHLCSSCFELTSISWKPVEILWTFFHTIFFHTNTFFVRLVYKLKACSPKTVTSFEKCGFSLCADSQLNFCKNWANFRISLNLQQDACFCFLGITH